MCFIVHKKIKCYTALNHHYVVRSNFEVILRFVMCPMTAAVHAWKADFKGHASFALINTITDLLSPMAKGYARATCIINSSGTGKSRMVDEISMSIISVPMCLRPRGSQGYITHF